MQHWAHSCVWLLMNAVGGRKTLLSYPAGTHIRAVFQTLNRYGRLKRRS